MKQHCCNQMEQSLNDKRVPIDYNEVFREYALYIFYSLPQQFLSYCPWCGTLLPESLREQYFDILENEYQIEVSPFQMISRDTEIPPEFKSDEWWKKRKL